MHTIVFVKTYSTYPVSHVRHLWNSAQRGQQLTGQALQSAVYFHSVQTPAPSEQLTDLLSETQHRPRQLADQHHLAVGRPWLQRPCYSTTYTTDSHRGRPHTHHLLLAIWKNTTVISCNNKCHQISETTYKHISQTECYLLFNNLYMWMLWMCGCIDVYFCYLADRMLCVLTKIVQDCFIIITHLGTNK